MHLGFTLGLANMPTTSAATALNLTAPALGEAPIGQPVSVDLGVWAPGTTLVADLLRDGVVIQTGLDGSDIVFTPADDEASLVLRVMGAPANGGEAQEVSSAPVTARYAPPTTVPAQVPQTPEIYDENTGPQTLDLGPAFAGEALAFTATGLMAVTIDAATGVLTTSTNVPISSGQVTVVAQNSGGSAAITVDIIVEDDGDMILTPTTMQTSVTDPLTGHVYSFVAADGVTPEAREVGQYQDGTWFVLGEAGDEVRIGSITPVSTSVSTAAYTEPDNCDDVANTGPRTRWMHGTMVNPWQGVIPKGSAPLGFESYHSNTGTGASIRYQHDLNVDPGKTGAPLVLAEGSVVKAESFPEEGGHSVRAEDKTRILKFSCLSVVPEIPAASSFRPPIRGVDKTSRWSLSDIDLASHRRIIPGFRPFTIEQIDAATAKIRYIQQTFAPHQEPSRRWNPGARGGGVGVYGDVWYSSFAAVFGCFHGDYTEAEIGDLIRATVQVGVDIYGLLKDDGYYSPAQAHHAGRKGICFMAALLLQDPDMLDQCNFHQHPEHFGVDDHYCGYVSQQMIGVQPRYYKGAYPYAWEQEHLGLAEWATVFPEGTEDQVATEEQVADSDIARRSYQVLSFDNGAMYQCLFGMISDPAAQYYNPAYFDFADRYLAIRFGDQLDGAWDASSDSTGTNNHFTGNWWSINPSDTVVANFKEMRDACARPSHVPSLIPEALPRPQVTHTGSNDYLEVDFNTNNFRCPQDKDAPITGYELRWTAYAGGADAVASESDEAYIGTFNWTVIQNIPSFPYQLQGVPRGLKVKVQIRMINANGPGPWLDDRKRENYAHNSTVFSVLSGTQRYSTNFDVPDIAAFDQAPQNFKAPSATPEQGAITGGIAVGNEGVWSASPAADSTEYQWQVSNDGLTGWADIPGATSINLATTSAEEGRFIRLGVRKTNSIGGSGYAYANAGLPVVPPVAMELGAGRPGVSPFDPGAGALGGKRLLIMYAIRTNSPITIGGSIGGYSFGAAETLHVVNGASRERSVVYQVVVPGGETAETITFASSAADVTAVAVYELTEEMQVTDTDTAFSGLTLTVDTVSGGAAFWLARSSGWVNFVSSASLTQHSDNPVQDTSAKFAAAHAFGVADGTVSVTHSNAAASNTVVTLISLQPVS